MQYNRTGNAVRSVAIGTISNIYSTIMPFVVRTVMLYTMGAKYLGLSGLFVSILEVLNLAELGVRQAMIFSMYKPLAEDDTEKVCALLSLYRKYYYVIGIVVGILGLVLLPFLPYLIKEDIPAGLNLYVLYLLSLGETVVSYFLYSYRSALLFAVQRHDLISRVNIIVNTLRYASRILVLVLTHNYYLFLIVSLVTQAALNIGYAIMAKKYYPNYKPLGNVSAEIRKDISTRVKDMFTQKVGKVVLISVDAIVISAFLGLTELSIYQNYYYVLTLAMFLVSIISDATLGGIGNGFAVDSPEENLKTLRKISLVTGGVLCVCCSALTALYQHFMLIWTGKELMLTFGYVILFIVYYFLTAWNRILDTFKDSAGIWHKDKWRPLIAAGVNLVLNLVLVNFIGLYGILISTIVSLLFISLPWEVNNLFSLVYKQGKGKYLLLLLKIVIVTGIGCGFTWAVCRFLPGEGILWFIVKGIISVIISSVVLYLAYGSDKEAGDVTRAVINVLPFIKKEDAYVYKPGFIYEVNYGRFGFVKNILYYIYVLGLFAATSMGLNSGSKLYVIIFVVGMLAVLIKILLGVYSGKEILGMLAVLGLFIVVYLRNGDRTLLMSFIAIAGVKDIDLKRLFKVALPVRFVLIGLTMSAAALGLIENRLVFESKDSSYFGLADRAIYGYGFEYANHAFWGIFTIAILALVVYGEKIKLRHYFYISVVLFAAYNLLACNTGWMCWILVLLVIGVYKLMRNEKSRGNYLKFLSFVPLICCGFVMWLSSYATSQDNLPLFFGKVIKGNLFARFNMAYPVMGQLIHEPLGSAVREWKDIGYVHLFHNYGWIIGVIFMALYTVTMWKLAKKKQAMAVIALTAGALYLMAEFTPLSTSWNLTLLLFGVAIFPNSEIIKETEINGNRGKNMREVSIISILKEMVRRKWITVAVIVLTAFLAAGYGYVKSGKTASLSGKDQATVNNYDLTVESTKTNIANTEEQYAISVKQMEDQQKYVDNAVYMKLDSTAYCAINVQVKISETSDLAGVLNDYTLFVNDGDFRSNIASAAENIDPDYLKEVISCAASYDVFSVNMMYFDEEAAKRLADSIEEVLKEQASVVAENRGSFKTETIAKSVQVKADSGILNGQNGVLNNLKSYKNTVTDLENRLNSYRTSLENLECDPPAEVSKAAPVDRKKAVLKYGIIGVMGGIVFAFLVVMLVVLFDDKMRTEKDVRTAGLYIANKYSKEKGKKVTDVDYTLEILKAEAGKASKPGIVIALPKCDMDALSTEEKAVIKELLIKGEGTVTLSENTLKKSEGLEALGKAGTLFAVYRSGVSTFSEINSMKELSQRFGVNMPGLISVK